MKKHRLSLTLTSENLERYGPNKNQKVFSLTGTRDKCIFTKTRNNLVYSSFTDKFVNTLKTKMILSMDKLELESCNNSFKGNQWKRCWTKARLFFCYNKKNKRHISFKFKLKPNSCNLELSLIKPITTSAFHENSIHWYNFTDRFLLALLRLQVNFYRGFVEKLW